MQLSTSQWGQHCEGTSLLEQKWVGPIVLYYYAIFAMSEVCPPPQVHVLAAVCKKGTILLVPGCLRVLGGRVESMAAVNSPESVLSRAM